jgi:acyl-CoA synthetase (AMP-forming)/AMP-acid ligase II
MPAADETELVAVAGAGRELADAARRVWDGGKAILALNPKLSRRELELLLERLQPGRVPVAADTAAVVVTSGTSGEPKGAELTRTGMEVMGRGYSDGLDAGPSDRWLACLPLHHVASLAIVARSYITGVPCTVHDTFDVGRVAASPRTEGTSIVSLVPTALRRLLDAGAPLDEFRRVIVGGAPCPASLRARAEARGIRVVDAYGLSETWGGFALDGVPIAGADVRLADDAEILVRGAMVMRGYRLDETRTPEVLTREGWLRTGDAGTIDDGRLRVVERLKDVVITGGVNVSPTEIEGVLMTSPAVQDVCVVGVPDDEWGERVVAFVVPSVGAVPTVDDLRAHARARLSVAKLPREVRLVEVIPRTASGKPLRRLLRGS